MFFASARRLVWLAIILGIAVRVMDYARNRAMWMDESNLRLNVAGRPVFEFDRPLVADQLAPPGFLVAARLSAHVLGTSPPAIRFLPLVCGVASLFLLRRLAERTVSPVAVPIALALAAFSDDLIYYAGEFKQYSSDLLTAMACTLLVLDLGSRPITARRAALAASLGMLATWISHPSVFVLGGGGLWLAVSMLAARRWREALMLATVGTIWVSSFAACYVVSTRLLGEGQFMWTWWHFAFLPLPPRSWADVDAMFSGFLRTCSPTPWASSVPLVRSGADSSRWACSFWGWFRWGGVELGGYCPSCSHRSRWRCSPRPCTATRFMAGC